MRGEIVTAAEVLNDHRAAFDDRPGWRARAAIAQAAIKLERGDAPQARAACSTSRRSDQHDQHRPKVPSLMRASALMSESV